MEQSIDGNSGGGESEGTPGDRELRSYIHTFSFSGLKFAIWGLLVRNFVVRMDVGKHSDGDLQKALNLGFSL